MNPEISFVIKRGSRYFYGIGKAGQVLTAYRLGGAKTFVSRELAGVVARNIKGAVVVEVREFAVHEEINGGTNS